MRIGKSGTQLMRNNPRHVNVRKVQFSHICHVMYDVTDDIIVFMGMDGQY